VYSYIFSSASLLVMPTRMPTVSITCSRTSTL
jgi:hypothetical protein